VSTITLGDPFANSHPGEATILAGLLKRAALRNLEPPGEFGGSQEIVLINCVHVSFKIPNKQLRNRAANRKGLLVNLTSPVPSGATGLTGEGVARDRMRAPEVG